MTVPPLHGDRHATEAGWRRTLLLAFPVAALAFLIGWILDGPSDQITPYDQVAYPLLTLGVVALEVVLWRARRSTDAVVTALVLLASLFFLSKLVYVLYLLPAGGSVQAEMSESFFWIPAIYVLSLFVPNLRAARAISGVFFSGMLLVSLGYAAHRTWTDQSIGVAFALTELNLANLTLLTLTNVFIGYKDRLTQAQGRSETLQRLAYTDLLTGLPNRLQLETALRHQQGDPFSLLFVDLDGFKLVNDTLGHSAGDAVLQLVAERLRPFLQAGDLAARSSGDEFVVILAGAAPERALALAHQLLASLIQPYTAQGQLVRLTASIGVSAYPHDAQDTATLLRHADAAMYHVKSSGKNGVRRFDGTLDAQLERRKLLERELQFALLRAQLSLAYQPIVQLATGRPLKVEALLRWTHPEFGSVSPASFIPIAESSGLIVQLGAWVLQAACAQARRWRDDTGQPVVVTVNVAAVQFAQPNFVQLVQGALLDSGLPASALELELTEGAVIGQPEAVHAALRELQRLGVGIAIDDFGTGYSSLSYLRDLPINAIKIDRSFISDLSTPRRAPHYALALVEAIVGIARTLDLQVVAEGVETSTQLELVRSLGCDFGQGYVLARPSDAAGITALLRHPLSAAVEVPAAHLN